MTDPAFRIRPGTLQDTRAAFDVFVPAVRDLSTRQGAPWEANPEEMWPRMEPIISCSRHRT